MDLITDNLIKVSTNLNRWEVKITDDGLGISGNLLGILGETHTTHLKSQFLSHSLSHVCFLRPEEVLNISERHFVNTFWVSEFSDYSGYLIGT